VRLEDAFSHGMDSKGKKCGAEIGEVATATGLTTEQVKVTLFKFIVGV
jgi:hypothetical protein